MEESIKSRTWGTERHARAVETSLVTAGEFAHEFIARGESDDGKKRENQRYRARDVPPTENLGHSVIRMSGEQSNGQSLLNRDPGYSR